MATSSPRDVKLGLSVETTGDEKIKELQKSVAALAKEGGDAAPEFQALADEIGRLGEQQQTITKIRALNDAFDELVAKQEAAGTAAAENAAKLTEAGRAADRLRAAQERAGEVQAQAKAALAETNSALTILRNSYDENGNRVDGYKAKLQQLIVTKEAEKRAVTEAKASYDAAKEATAAAAKTADNLEKAYNRSAAEATKLGAAVREQSQVLESAAAAAASLGVSSTNLAAEQARVSMGLADAQREAAALRGQLDALADAERDVAAATALAAQQAEEQAEALRVADAARAAAEAKALADAERLLAAEFQFAAESARRLAAAQDEAAASAARLRQEQADDFTRKLAVAQGLLTTELELAAAASEHAAAEQRQLDAAQAAAAESARQAAAAAAEAGQRIEAAFGTVGVRSAEALQSEIAQVRAAMDALSARSRETGQAMAGAFAAGESKIASLERELRELNGQLTVGDRAAKLFSNSLGQIAAGNLIADAVGALVERVKDLGRAFVTVITQTESMRRGLTAVYGSAETAREQIEFLRRSSIAAGISMSGIADSFVRFSAATRSSNIPLQVTNDLFSAVTRAGSTLGLSSERVTLALDALGQMASKGVVSMEELRQQLGDSLPGALSIAAKGLGITDQQLIKLVESGQLAARDLFPALTEGLKSLGGESDTIVGAWGRLKTAFSTAAEVGGDAGWTQVLRGGLDALRLAAAAVVIPLSAFMEVVFGLAKAAGVLVGAVATLSDPMGELGQIADDAAARQQKLRDTFAGTTDAAGTNAAALQQNAAAAGTATSGTIALALAQNRATIAAGGANEAALGVARANVQLLLSFAEATKTIEANVAASGKLLAAKKAEGEALVTAARVGGDANAIMEAQAAATFANVEAAETYAAALASESANTQALIDKRTALAIANNALDENEKKALATMEDKLRVQTAAAEKADQEAASLRAVAVAARLAADAYADNSAKLNEYSLALRVAQSELPAYRTTLEQANAELVRQQQLLKDGKGSLDAVAQAEREARAAKEGYRQATENVNVGLARYKDALADTIRNIQLKAQTEAAALNVTLATVNAGRSHAETMANIARAQGNETQATYYAIEAKTKQIEAVRLATRIKTLEINANIAALESEKAAIPVNDKLREQKIAEIEIRLQVQKAKLIEAGASADVIRGLEAEIAAIRNNAAARSGSTGATQADTSARYANRDAINAQTAALERQQVTSDGFKANKDGAASGTFSNSLPVQDAFAIIEKMQRGTLGAGDLEQARTGYEQARNSQQWLQSLNPGSVSTEARTSTDALVRGAEQALRKAEAAARKEARGGQNTTGQFGSSAASTNHTVQISIGGRTTAVGVGSPQDAQALTGVLRQLESAAGTAQ